MTAAFLLALLAVPARAQISTAAANVAVSSPVAAAPSVSSPTAGEFGFPLDPNKGPWVIGDIRFKGNQTIGTFALQGRVRARAGILYTPSDLANDAQELRSVPNVLTVRAAVYAIPDQKVPDSYATIAASPLMARVVYTIEEKTSLLPGLAPGATVQLTKAQQEAKLPPAPISGVILTPTAYRGFGRYTSPGVGMDINTVYYIGRLYGKNSVTIHPTNYIDRLGVWLVSADGKMQIQSEGDIRPAVAVGGQMILPFRDAPQPPLQGSFNVTVNPNNKQGILSDGYFVASKKIYSVRSSLGVMQGNGGNQIGLLSEFLSPQSLQFLYNAGAVSATSNTVFFGSLMAFPKPHYPLAVEFLKPNGMVLSPWLLNFKIGYFLKLNFDVSYLHFQGGWDLLGTFQFRYTYFPRG